MTNDELKAEMRAAEARMQAQARSYDRWKAGKASADDHIAAYKHAEEHNKSKGKDEPALPLPEIVDIVQAHHVLICTSSTKEPEWFEWDPRTSCYEPVENIVTLVVAILDKLEIPTKQTNSIVNNVRTRLAGRCAIRGLQRAPCVLHLDKRQAYTFHELNRRHPNKKPCGYPVACKTCWYLIKEDGSFKRCSYGPNVFLLNRLEADPEEGEPTYTQQWLEERIGADQAEAFWEWASYCLTPHNTLKKFHIWFGPGNTGKSTAVGLLELILGAQNVGSQSAINLDYTRHKFATSALRGKLLNISEEDPGYGTPSRRASRALRAAARSPGRSRTGPAARRSPPTSSSSPRTSPPRSWTTPTPTPTA